MAEVINRIAWLEKQIDQVKSLISNEFKYDDFGNLSNSDWLAKRSYETLLNNYQTDLRREKELLRKEVLDFRLIGDKVNNGTLPLGMLAKIADKLNKTLHYAAYFIRHGVNPTSGVSQETTQQIDLRLSGILIGSCNLQITGNIMDDLAGDSLLGDAYQKIFNILSPEEEVSFKSIAPTIGNSAVQNLDDLLEEVQKNGVALQLRWAAPTGKTYIWGGKKEDLAAARLKLEKIKTLEPVTMDMTGKVTDLSNNGFIKIIEADSTKPIKIKFFDDLEEIVDTLTLNDYVIAKVTRKSTVDEVTGVEKHTYYLDHIRLDN